MQAMRNILIRDIPDEVHQALHERARAKGQSLQQYLAGELTRLAQRPTVEDLFGRIEERQGGRVGFEQAVADLDSDRSAS